MNILCLIKLRHIRQDVRYPSIAQWQCVSLLSVKTGKVGNPAQTYLALCWKSPAVYGRQCLTQAMPQIKLGLFIGSCKEAMRWKHLDFFL